MGFRILRRLDHDKIAMEHFCLHSVQADYLLLRGGNNPLSPRVVRMCFVWVGEGSSLAQQTLCLDPWSLR